MPKVRHHPDWVRHPGTPQIPITITQPMRFVQIKEDKVRGRCRFARAMDVDWERVTHWRYGRPSMPSKERHRIYSIDQEANTDVE